MIATKKLIVALAAISVLLMSAVTHQANGQMPPGFKMPKEVSGKYVNSEFGVEVVFPQGLTGMEMSTDWSTSVNMVFDQTSMGSMLMLNMIDLAKAPKGEDSGGGAAPPSDKSQKPEKSDVKCETSSKNVKINGVDATETIMECKGSNVSMKSKNYHIDLGKERQVTFMYMANPASNYDKYVSKFDASAKTLKVAKSGSTTPEKENAAEPKKTVQPTKSDISVTMKVKKKETSVTVKNNSDKPVYAFKIKLVDGSIKSVQAKGWKSENVDQSTVLIKTLDKPIKQGKTLTIKLKVDGKGSYEWRAFDDKMNELAAGRI